MGFLQRNVRQNCPQADVAFHQAALFDRRDTLKLAKAAVNIGDHRINLGVPTQREQVEVPALPLDDFLDQLTGPVAVKVDTQGAEPYIVAGGAHVFARAGLVVMEFCPFLMRQMGGDPGKVLDLIADFPLVALLAPGNDAAPRYIKGKEAVALLRDKLANAAASDGDYLDIIARRAPAA